jgi:hypothetical protein
VCDLEVLGDPSILRIILNDAVFGRMLTTFELICEEKSARR